MGSSSKGCAARGTGCLIGLGLVLFLSCGGLYFFSGQANDAARQVRSLPPQQPPRVDPAANDVAPEHASSAPQAGVDDLALFRATEIAYKTPAEVDRILGKPSEVLPTTHPPEDVPGEYHGYGIGRPGQFFIVSVVFYRGRAVDVSIDSIDPPASTSEEALRLVGLSERSLIGKPDTENPNPDRAKKWTGTVDGINLTNVHAFNRGRSEWWTVSVSFSRSSMPKSLALKSQPRTWTSTDGKFKIEAEFVGVENRNVRLKKSGGNVITVPLEKLSPNDQQLIEESETGASAEAEPEGTEPLAKFTACFTNGKRLPVRDYQEDGDRFILFSVGGGKIGCDKSEIERFEPCTESDLTALKRKIAAARKEAAKWQARQEEKARQSDLFMERLADKGIDRSMIGSVSVKGETATIRLSATVSNEWDIAEYQRRLQLAQGLWKLWASIASPGDPDKARITLVDFNGNEVGGSRIRRGSLIWVQQ
ncbi:MAG TPA: SHD1 domain-containing protein [Pirellulales bacterium]|nr:SHD1 domain-containing protein [Pirellulales bacterium]